MCEVQEENKTMDFLENFVIYICLIYEDICHHILFLSVLPLHAYALIHALGCGGTLTTSTGGFTSPNYPLPYHPNAECYWHIKTNAGSRIQLSFGDFHLESSTGCYYDYLAVRTGIHFT